MLRRLILNETFYFGTGSYGAAAFEAGRRGLGKALFVVDPGLVETPAFIKLKQSFQQKGIGASVFSGVTPNPDVQCVQNGLHAFKAARADCVVAVGGGSTQDTAKAISLIISNPRHTDVLSLESQPATQKRAVPLIALPTTAGSGSEANMNFVITDREKKRKFVCSDPNANPPIVIIDPLLMASMPAGLIASTGMDALTHAIEGYVTRGAWELTDALNVKAIELIGRALRRAVRGDLAALADVALGQYMTGMTFANVGLGLVHGMAHPLGGLYDTPHGLANAVLLPYVLAFNAPAAGKKYKAIAVAMGVKGADALTAGDAARVAVRAVRQLAVDTGIPSRLQMIDVLPEDLPLLAEMAAVDPSTHGNPRACNAGLIFEVYKAAY